MGYTPPPSIDAGNAATDRTTGLVGGRTYIDRINPANLTGKIRSVEIFVEIAMTLVEVATFYRPDPSGFPLNFSTRDTHTVGSLAIGYHQIDVDLDVTAGDSIGIYYATGQLSYSTETSVGEVYKTGDFIPCTDELFIVTADRTISLYGTGDTGDGVLTIGEAFSIGDSLVKNVTKQLSEAFSAVDSLVKNVIKQVGEAFSVIDSWVARISFSEAFSIADSLIKSAIKQLSEAVSIADSWAVRICFYETLKVRDSFKRFFKNLYSKISKGLSSYTKVDKDISTYTKTDKSDSDYTKKDRERGEE